MKSGRVMGKPTARGRSVVRAKDDESIFELSFVRYVFSVRWVIVDSRLLEFVNDVCSHMCLRRSELDSSRAIHADK